MRLPADTYYVSVDHGLLSTGMKKIEEQFRDLLQNGTQASGLPEGYYAAGQYLNPYSINQRGLYGTAAALLVFARSSPSQDRINLIEGIIRYIRNRSEVEHSLTHSELDRSALDVRLATEANTAFKCADLLYALSVAPPAVTGREELINDLLTRIRQSRRDDGGWAVDLDPQRGCDPLATASIIRALNAAGVSIAETDIALVRESAHDERNVSAYVRVFCLLVLLEVAGRDSELDILWKQILADLAPQLRDRTEANYEFTLANHYHYVRVPWQLYLASCVALHNPLNILFNQSVRKVLLDCIAALNTAHGYVYDSSGHMRSTRTYSILMDTLWSVDKALSTSRHMIPISMLANWGVRIVYSRPITGLILSGAFAISGLAIWSWISNSKLPISAVGPELFTAGLMAAIALLLRQLRQRLSNNRHTDWVHHELSYNAQRTPLSVSHVLRNDSTHSTLRVRRVTGTSRDQVDVGMHDGLACSLPTVHAYVEADDGRIGLLQSPA